jgi:hypothetical protein
MARKDKMQWPLLSFFGYIFGTLTLFLIFKAQAVGASYLLFIALLKFLLCVEEVKNGNVYTYQENHKFQINKEKEGRIKKMLVIGEKLSIIAKRVREAMEKRDKGPIQEIAKAQAENGAGMIDANIGPAEDGGPELMEWMVTTIQESVKLPVCLDTTNHEALEAGLKVHNNEWGRPLINSTSNDPRRS